MLKISLAHGLKDRLTHGPFTTIPFCLYYWLQVKHSPSLGHRLLAHYGFSPKVQAITQVCNFGPTNGPNHQRGPFDSKYHGNDKKMIKRGTARVQNAPIW